MHPFTIPQMFVKCTYGYFGTSAAITLTACYGLAFNILSK